jgi:hypothetical protein
VVVGHDAASDANTTVHTDSGGGGSDAGGGDGGDGGPALSTASCGPATTPASFANIPPVSLPGSCLSQQIAGYIEACGIPAAGTGQSCDDFHAAAGNGDCLACLETNVDAGAWGAVAYDLGLSEEYVNIGGCFVTVSDAGDALACAKASTAAPQCEVAACEAACAGHDTDAGQDCIAAADDGGCATENEAYGDCAANVDLENEANEQCVGEDFNSSLLLVATVLCGGGQ